LKDAANNHELYHHPQQHTPNPCFMRIILVSLALSIIAAYFLHLGLTSYATGGIFLLFCIIGFLIRVKGNPEIEMSLNPYAPPASKTTFFGDLPRAERKRLILEGKVEDAGPLLVFAYKHPWRLALIALIAFVTLIAGCATLIFMR
jgi:hypothetical protein